MSAVFSAADDDFASDRQVAQLRIPPHSIEAESSVLGGLLLDNSAWDRIGDVVINEDFYRHDHRLIFQAIVKLIERSHPADVVTVSEQLEKSAQLGEVGGLDGALAVGAGGVAGDPVEGGGVGGGGLPDLGGLLVELLLEFRLEVVERGRAHERLHGAGLLLQTLKAQVVRPPFQQGQLTGVLQRFGDGRQIATVELIL